MTLSTPTTPARSALVALVVAISTCAGAQTLREQLTGKETFHEIMQVVETYYSGQDAKWRGPNGDDPRLIDWERWAWYQSGRLGSNGEFVDIRARLEEGMKVVEKMESRYADQRSVNPFWSSVGPSSVDNNSMGRADRIAFHPTDPDIFYVGAPAGGLWRTTNGGSSWTALTDHIPSTGISGIVVSWQDPNDLYILTGDADSDYFGGLVDSYDYERKSIGVLRSVDNGQTWFASAQLDTNFYHAFKMVQDPTDSDVLLVATDLGIYRTDNRGNTWTKVRSGVFFDVEFKPGTTIAYGAGKTEVVWSWTGGEFWDAATLDVPLSGVKRSELAVTPANPSRVYLLVGDVDADSTYDGTYRSVNSGLSYTLMGTTPNILGRSGTGNDDYDQCEYDHSFAVSSANSNTLISGAVNIWRSTNGGVNYSLASTGIHVDIHDLAYNPLDDKLYACTDGGVFVSENNGNSWTGLLDGFRTSQFYRIDGTLADNNFLIGGLQDNGIKIKNGAGTSWDHVQGADGYSVSFFPNDETQFYTTTNRSAWRVTNSGGTVDNITPPNGGNDFPFFGNIEAHVSNIDYVFLAWHDVYVSDDQGENWTNTGATGRWTLATCPSNGNRIYGAGPSTFQINGETLALLYRTDNMGDDWTTLHVNPGFPDPTDITKITDIAVDPTNSNKVFVTIGGFTAGLKVFRSTDAGANWTNFSGNFPNVPVNAVAVMPGGDAVYIATDLGVFYRSLSMTDWMPVRNGLPNSPVSDLFINTDNDRIYAATFGRGVWRASLVTTCQENIALGGFMSGNFYYQANNQITSTTNVDGGIGTAVYFKAGNRVILTPGFVAERHTKFRAYIGECGAGGIPD